MANLNSKATVTLSVNGQQARKMLSALEQDAKKLEAGIARAATAGDKASMQRLQRELNSVRGAMRQLSSSARTTEQVLMSLSKASPKELTRALRTLRSGLNNIERGSDAWKAHMEKIRKVKGAIADLNAEMREQQGFFSRMKGWVKDNALGALGLTASVTGLVTAARSCISAYGDMEQEMRGVRKYTGMTAEEVDILNARFKEMDTSTSREELNRLAQDAGRLGKTGVEDVMGYVSAANKIKVALDELGDDAPLILSKLTSVFGDEARLGTEQALLSVGSVINELSQNCSASAPYLVDFAQRLGGVGSQAGMTVQQIMAFGAVLDSNGQNVEKSATALQKVITNIYKDPAAYASAAGLEVKKFSDLVRTDMNEALMLLLSTLGKAGKMDVLAPMFDEMGEKGSGAIATLSTLAGQIDAVRAQQQEANTAFQEATSITKEAEMAEGSVNARFEKSQKVFHELAVELGATLMPAVNVLTRGAVVLTGIIRTLLQVIIQNKGVIITAAAAYALYSAALHKAALQKALLNAAAKTGTFLKTAGRVATLAAAAAYNLFTGNLTRATAATRALSAATSATSWGVILAALTLVITAIVKYASANSEAAKKAALHAQAEKQQAEYMRSAAQEAQKEAAALDTLYAAATNETLSKEKRIEAANRLKALYPEQFKNMTAEQIMLGQAASAYDNLRKSIIAMARAKAAAKLIEEKEADKLETEQRKSNRERTLRYVGAKLEKEKEKEAKGPGVVPVGTGQTPLYTKGAKTSHLQQVADDTRAAIDADNKRLERLDKEISKLSEQAGVIQELGTTKNPTTTPTGGGGSKSSTKKPDKYETEKKWLEESQEQTKLAYYTQQTDYAGYLDKMDALALEYYDRLLAHTDLTEAERTKLLAARYEEQEQQTREHEQRDQQAREEAIKAQEASYAEEVAALKGLYLDGEISTETYQLKTEEAEIRHQRELVKLTKEGSRERQQAYATLQDKLLAQAQRIRQAAKTQAETDADLLKSYFPDTFYDPDGSKINEMLAKLQALSDLRYKLLAEAKTPEEKEQIETSYQLGRRKIRKDYGQEPKKPKSTNLGGKMKESIEGFADWLDSDGGKALTGSMSTLVSGMSEIFSGLTTFMQAELEMQTAAINKYYDHQISLAEGNAYQEKILEERRQKDIAKAKADANKKMFAMQVIQAVAQTAQNALAAYGSAAAIPTVGFIMAPIAAAMAVAAGAIQIAAIKKQQQASEAQGYAEGGFTKPGDKYEPAGIVHAGEWVASQTLVNDPEVRPLLQVLDRAQQAGIRPTLRTSDVSRAITAPIELAARPIAATEKQTGSIPATAPAQTSDYALTMKRLADRLEQPFVTVNTMTGDHGILQAQQEYDLLMRNKSPKSRS